MSLCLTPFIKKKKNQVHTKRNTDVFPCGKCPNCVKRRVSGWTFRLQEEQKIADTSAFITWTYKNSDLPFTDSGHMTLRKKDFQNFMKRLRVHIKETTGKNYPIKYYTCGEYGTKTNRPHYHSIIFNLPAFYLDNPIILEQIWNHGGIYIDSCNNNTIAYVAGYVMKKTSTNEYKNFVTYYDVAKSRTVTYLKKEYTHPIDDREKEFSLMSKKMGLSYIAQFDKKELKLNKKGKHFKEKKDPYFIIEGGKKIQMPRYFKEKLFSDSELTEVREKAKAHAMEKTFRSEHHKLEYAKQQFALADRKNKNSRL